MSSRSARLNKTVSEMKKRQEIGRGLRLAVNQYGERVFDDEVNILSVIANESYENYASRLQGECRRCEVHPSTSTLQSWQGNVHRNDTIFNESKEFKDFWLKFQKKTAYEIHVDTPALIEECVEKLTISPFPKRS